MVGKLLAQRTFGEKLHNRISSQKMTQEVWNIKLDWKSQVWLNYVLIKSNRTALQTYKGEERTFGTPCILRLDDEIDSV